jgi:DHA2 family methylenomycin A resistance protein-like MFS transporter
VPVVAGLLLAAAALWLLTGIQVGTSYAALWWKLALLGAGLGLSISPATAAGVAAMPGTQAGVASAVITTSRQVGGALGVAVLGAVAAARSSAVLPVRLAAAGVPGPVREQVETAAGQGLGASSGPAAAGAAREAVAAAFVTGVHTSYLVAGAALAAGAVAALLFLRPRRARPGSGDASVPAEIAPGSLGG